MAIRNLVATWAALLALLGRWQAWLALAVLAALHLATLPLARWLRGGPDPFAASSARLASVTYTLRLTNYVVVMAVQLVLSRALVPQRRATPAAGRWLAVWLGIAFALAVGGAGEALALQRLPLALSHRATVRIALDATLQWALLAPSVWVVALACGETAYSPRSLWARLQPGAGYWLAGFVPLAVYAALPTDGIIIALAGGTPLALPDSFGYALLQALLRAASTLANMLFAIAAFRQMDRGEHEVGQIFA